jgi:hypothetical protein
MHGLFTEKCNSFDFFSKNFYKGPKTSQGSEISVHNNVVKNAVASFGHFLWLLSGSQGPGFSFRGRYLPGFLRCHGLCLRLGCFGLGLVERFGQDI